MAASLPKAQKELIQAAEVKAALGRIALLEFSCLQAAVHFHDAGDMLPSQEAEKRHGYREAEANALYHQGDERPITPRSRSGRASGRRSTGRGRGSIWATRFEAG